MVRDIASRLKKKVCYADEDKKNVPHVNKLSVPLGLILKIEISAANDSFYSLIVILCSSKPM